MNIYHSIKLAYNSQYKGGDGMPKFVAKKPEKEVISLRVDSEILKSIDSKAAAIGISRNELINQMILYAMDNMADNEEETL